MKQVVRIEGIAAGGDGVGRMKDGMAIFVPRSAPGDVVEVEITRQKAKYARGRLVELVKGGPDRVDPACHHYVEDSCGGCQLQHMSAEGQLAAKRKLVGEAVRRIGRKEIADPPIVVPDRPWRYRTKVSLAATRKAVGLRMLSSPDTVFELADCLIVRESLMDLWAELRVRRTLLPRDMESLVLREDRTGCRHVMAVGGSVGWNADRLASEMEDSSLTFWWKPSRGAARVVRGAEVGFPATAFEQSSRATAEHIRVRAVEYLGDLAGKVAWDLYGGVGDTAELLADGGARVWSVERDKSAIDWGVRHGSRDVTRVAGLVEETLARLPKPDVVVVNPPRVGMAKEVARWLDRRVRSGGAVRLAYISCDPATLARDLARMPNLRVEGLEAYDLFPQTAHVETLAMMEAA